MDQEVLDLQDHREAQVHLDHPALDSDRLDLKDSLDLLGPLYRCYSVPSIAPTSTVTNGNGGDSNRASTREANPGLPGLPENR